MRATQLTLLVILRALAGCDDRGPVGDPVSSAAPAEPATTAATTTASATASAPAPAPEPWLERVLRASDPRFTGWLADATALRLQILVTVVEPDAARWPAHGFRVDAEYFYPASAIKPLLAVAALRSLARRAGGSIPLGTRILRCRDDRPGCEPPEQDEKKADHEDQREPDAESERDPYKHEKLRVGEEITKMLSYSDNDSYNRLFDIVGHRELNEDMARLGLSSVRFHHRMDAAADRSKKTLRVLLAPPGRAMLEVALRVSDFEPAPTPAPGLKLGNAYKDGRGLVEEPMDFGNKNYVSLVELQRVIRAIVFPAREPGVDLGLSESEMKHLVSAMTARLKAERHAAEHHPLSPGVLEVMPAKRLRFIGKSGRAYGFHLDNAYVEDVETRRAFFVTVVVYSNPDGVLNDDDYGYDETTRPLLAALGAALTRELLKKGRSP